MYTVTTKRGANLGSFDTLENAANAVHAARLKMNDEARVKRDGALFARVWRLCGETFLAIKGEDAPLIYNPSTNEIN